MSNKRYRPQKRRGSAFLNWLYCVFFLSLVTLKLLGQIHIPWGVVFLPIWWPVLLTVCFFLSTWGYLETLGRVLKNSDEVFGFLLDIVFLPLFFFGIFYVLNAIFLWVDLLRLPDFLSG